MLSDSSKGLMTCVFWSVAACVLVTVICLAIYRFNPSCHYVFRLPLLPGGLLVWSIWGDGFANSEDFDRLAIPIAVALNVLFGVLVGMFVFGVARFRHHSNRRGTMERAM